MAKTSGQLERDRIRKRMEIVITDFTTCYFCKTKGLTEQDMFCSNCGFPQRGTQTEMKRFVWSVRNKKKLMEESKAAIKKARLFLFILAGFNLLFGVMYWVAQDDIVSLIAGLIGAGIYTGLAFWSRKEPFAAILTGLFVYLLTIVLNGLIDPATIIAGLLWKAIIIGGFVYGFRGAKDAKRIEAELASISKAREDQLADDMPQV